MPQFTKKAIFKAFSRLIAVMPLDRITVRDIVEECGVNRNTFYYYFKDIYDLVDKIIESESTAFTNECSNLSDALDRILDAANFASENKKAIYHMYNSKKQSIASGRLHGIIKDMITDPVMKETPGCTKEDAGLIASYIAYGISGRMIDWIDGGMREDPAVIIEEMKRIFGGVAALAYKSGSKYKNPDKI